MYPVSCFTDRRICLREKLKFELQHDCARFSNMKGNPKKVQVNVDSEKQQTEENFGFQKICFKAKGSSDHNSFAPFRGLKKQRKGGSYGTSFGKIVSWETSNEQLECNALTSIQKSFRPGKMVEETG